jgi:hypothetical protein
MTIRDKKRILRAMTQSVEVYMRGVVNGAATARARRLIAQLDDEELAALALRNACMACPGDDIPAGAGT